MPISYDEKTQELRIGNHKLSLPLRERRLKLHLYADRTAFELFAFDGLVYAPIPIIPKMGSLDVTFTVQAGNVRIEKLTVDKLGSIWK